MAVVSIFAQLVDPALLPKNSTLGDKLYRLAVLAPQDAQDIERLVDLKLRKLWPPPRKHPKDAA